MPHSVIDLEERQELLREKATLQKLAASNVKGPVVTYWENEKPVIRVFDSEEAAMRFAEANRQSHAVFWPDTSRSTFVI